MKTNRRIRRQSALCVRLVVSFLRELLQANLAVARTVLSPRIEIRPAIIAFRTTLESDLALTSLANLITLTPGTFTLDVSEDRKTLYVHILELQDIERTCQEIHSAFESILEEIEG